MRLDEWLEDALDACAVDPHVQIGVQIRRCTPSSVQVVHVVVFSCLFCEPDGLFLVHSDDL